MWQVSFFAQITTGSKPAPRDNSEQICYVQSYLRSSGQIEVKR
jgi:hypothetical protein